MMMTTILCIDDVHGDDVVIPVYQGRRVAQILASWGGAFPFISAQFSWGGIFFL
jgi:hypothetical protein